MHLKRTAGLLLVVLALLQLAETSHAGETRRYAFPCSFSNGCVSLWLVDKRMY
jgi:hypothetical protein